MGTRRGHGEGSIYQRASDGLWIATVELGYVNGKRKRKTLSGKTRKEVADQLKSALHNQQQGLLQYSDRQTVAQFLDGWLADIVKPKVRPMTYRSYEENVRNHLKPSLGRHQLAKLAPQHVQQMMNEKSFKGLSPRTVQRMRDVLRNALGHALKWGLVSRNVATLVSAPSASYFEMRFLTPAEARKLLAAADGDRLEALYTVAVAMGLRQGESLALRWEDIDFESGTMRVRHSLQRIGGRLQLVEPKTSQSRRTLTMPPTVGSALQAHQERQSVERAAAGARWKEGNLVFASTIGTPLEARNVLKCFKQLLVAAGLPEMRWHDLRHSCASLLLVQGVSLPVVMTVLGHSQIAVTSQYTHVIPELRAQAATSMERIFSADDGK